MGTPGHTDEIDGGLILRSASVETSTLTKRERHSSEMLQVAGCCDIVMVAVDLASSRVRSSYCTMSCNVTNGRGQIGCECEKAR